MDIPTRLEANAIIDRLVADGQTFSREDARRLIDLIPVTANSRFSFKGSFKGPGSGIKGHAAGVGDIEMKGETREKQVSLNTPTSHKIGGYIVTHTPGHIAIDLMWSDTKGDKTGQSCSLIYDLGTKEPEEMHIAQQKTLAIFFLSFAYISYVPWKRPAAG
jgi:hypothetical protein